MRNLLLFSSIALMAIVLLPAVRSGASAPQSKPKIDPPKMLSTVEADCPRHAKHGHHVVTVGMVIDLSGLPTKLAVAKTDDPTLNQSALDAVKQYRFKPAMANGRPAAIEIFVDVNVDC